METTYVVFDEKGVIYSGTDLAEADKEFEDAEDTQGDVILAEEMRRRK